MHIRGGVATAFSWAGGFNLVDDQATMVGRALGSWEEEPCAA
jgi:hypothetical protein